MKSLYVTFIGFLSVLFVSIQYELFIVYSLIVAYTISGIWARSVTGDKSIISFKHWIAKLILYPMAVAVAKAVEGDSPVPYEDVVTGVISAYELYRFSSNISKILGYDFLAMVKDEISKRLGGKK